MSGPARYRIQPQSADGSHRASDTHLVRDVIVKPWWVDTDRVRLRACLTVLASIQSKHIADVYDLVDMQASGKVAVVEEHLDGRGLSEWEGSTSLSESDVLRVLLQMTGALDALHSHDLSPPSLDANCWRFDAEGLLNLSVFGPAPAGQGNPGEPSKLTDRRATADMFALAQHAQRLAKQHLATREVPSPALTDPTLIDLWNGSPTPTSTTAKYYERLNACLLRDQHRAVVIYRNRSAEVNAARRTLKLSHPNPSVAEATIHYDGTGFSVIASTGEAYLNNVPIVPHTVIPGSCVITLGAPSRSWNERHFITFDASHPEVVF